MTPADDAAARLSAALAARFGEPFDVPADLPGLDALAALAARSTHRDWADEPLPAGLLRLLAACALSAPTKSHLQQADIVEVRDEARRRAVEALVPSMPWMRRAPALLVFCANGRRFRRLFERRAVPFANEHLDGFFNPVVDASLVLMAFVDAASVAGLACCPISVLRDRADELARILELPAHVVPVAGLCVGRPRAARPIVPRLALSATLHVDRFDDRDVDAALDAFDARHVAARAAARGDAAGPPPPAWSDERVAQYASAQRADWGAFVRARGFDLG